MRRVSYDNLLRATCDRAGLDPTRLSTDEWRRCRDAISEALNWAWPEYWWPDTMRCERLSLRPEYSSTDSYPATAEVWFRPSNSHYVALVATIGNVPATWDGTDYVTNAAYWLRLADWPSKAPSDYNPVTAYTAGDVALYGDARYACHTASTGNAPTDTDYWGVLPDEWTYLPKVQVGRPAIGQVRAISAIDPRRPSRAANVDIWEMDDRIYLRGLAEESPWVWYQVRCPKLTGEIWDATATYSPEGAEEAGWGIPPAQKPDVLGDSFEDYPAGQTNNFNQGTGFTVGSEWQVVPEPDVVGDSFEDYTAGQTGNFNQGTGFTVGSEWQVVPELDVVVDSFESYSIGSVPDNGGTGFAGPWTIKTYGACAVDGVDAGDSFECYAVGYAGPFEAGNGWNGAWQVVPELDVVGDSFEDYTAGQTGNFNQGTGFTVGSEWQVVPELDVVGDSFESYSIGSVPDNGGTGFSVGWTITDGL